MIKEAFKKTHSSKIFKWFIGSIGALNVVLLFGKNYFELDLVTSILIGVGGGFLIIVLLFAYFLFELRIKNYFRKKKDSIYGEAIIYLKDAFGKIHFLRKGNNLNDELLKNSMAFFCQQLKIFYDKKTKSDCAVSVKIIQNMLNDDEIPNARVYNFCRDKDSLYRDTDEYKKQNHSIFNNTCYRVILTKITSGKSPSTLNYVNNDLTKTRDYQNSSWAVHKKPKKEEGNWELPYKSEIVVPIIPLEIDNTTKYKLIGFICVDSNETDVFHERYDSALLQGVADGVYDLLLNVYNN